MRKANNKQGAEHFLSRGEEVPIRGLKFYLRWVQALIGGVTLNTPSTHPYSSACTLLPQVNIPLIVILYEFLCCKQSGTKCEIFRHLTKPIKYSSPCRGFAHFAPKKSRYAGEF